MNTKYKFTETTGCTAFDFSVNGNSFSDMSEQEYNEMVNYVFTKLKESFKEHTIQFEDVVRLFQYDHCEDDNHICESCGDSVTTTIWNI